MSDLILKIKIRFENSGKMCLTFFSKQNISTALQPFKISKYSKLKKYLKYKNHNKQINIKKNQHYKQKRKRYFNFCMAGPQSS